MRSVCTYYRINSKKLILGSSNNVFFSRMFSKCKYWFTYIRDLLTSPLRKTYSWSQRYGINRVSCRPLDIIRGVRSKFCLCFCQIFWPSGGKIMHGNVNIKVAVQKIVHVHTHLIKVINQLQDIAPDVSLWQKAKVEKLLLDIFS